MELTAPALLEYEVNSSLRRATTTGLMTHHEAERTLQDILALDIQCVPPSLALHERALHWAGRLGQSKTYDAQYVALAEQERVDLWTADRRLATGARQIGVLWIHWIGEEEPQGDV